MSEAEKYAVVVGSLNCDTIYLQDRLPERGETYFAREAALASGGKGANQAAQLGRLGLKTYMVGKVGPDIFGGYLTGELSKSGVDVRHVAVGTVTSGLAAIHTMRDGSVYATVAPGANMELTVGEIEELRPLITGAAVLVLQMEIPRAVTEYAFRMAKSAGVYVVFNAAPALEVDRGVLTGADCLIVNETEAAGYLQVKDIASPQAAAAAGLEFVKAGGNTLIITLGSQGSVLVHGRETRHFPVDLGLGAVETTGCGDSYVGAFAYQKAMGADDETACAFASAASQLTATGVGAQPAMPDLAAVRLALASSRSTR